MTKEHPNLRPPWKKGESGNPKGRPKGMNVTARLKRILDENEGQVSEALAKAIIKAALKGDHKFVTTILDRVEGKVTDKLELDGQMRVVEQRFVVAKKPEQDDGD